METSKHTLKEFFNNEKFNVHLFKQDGVECAEIEKWTNGGVHMIIMLEPFIKEEFFNYVDNFDVDEEIDLYREQKLYRQNFTLTQSLKDFKTFYKYLKDVKKN
jgi:hypothetical protein